MNSSLPEVSASRLGRYCVATTPAARKRLLAEAKRPEEVAWRWYDGARAALVDFLTRGCAPEALLAHRERLLGGAPLDEHEAHRVSLCLEALERFERARPSLGLEGLSFHVPPTPHPLHLNGVAVRVAPEVLVTSANHPGQVGALAFYLSKHEPLPELAAEYMAILMLLHAQQHEQKQREVSPRLIRVVDVFAGRSYEAPRAFTRRGRDIALFCEEVAARWPTVH